MKIPNMRDSFLNKIDSQKKQQSRNLKGDNSNKEYASRVREQEAFLRYSESLIVVLIPANEFYPEQKNFSWRLERFSENGI